MRPSPFAFHEVDSFDAPARRGLRQGVLKLLLAAAALLLASAAPVSAETLPPPAGEQPRPEDGYEQETLRIAPGVWALVQPRFQVQPVGNVTVIEQTDGLVLVDAGGSPGSGRRIVATVRRLSSKPVKAVVITHWHGDHPQGLSEILAAWPQARTIATRATQAHLRERKTMNTPATFDAAADEAFQKQTRGFVAYALEMQGRASNAADEAGWAAAARLFRRYAEDTRGAVTLSTRESFEDALALPDRVAPVDVRFLGRANTDGDAVVWLPKQRVLVTGDIVVSPFPFGFGSYPADWLGVLHRLRAFDYRVLVPGHGRPQRDRAYLDRLEAAIVEIRGQVGELARQGLSLEETRKRLDLAKQADGFVGDDPWLRRWFFEYWVGPFATSAYKEAKGQPIVQSLGDG